MTDNHLQQPELLRTYGWNAYWDEVLTTRQEAFPQLSGRLSPARVTAQFSHSYAIIGHSGEYSAVVSGKFEFNAAQKGDFPAVGDWVLAELLSNERRAVIHNVLPRRSAMVRKAAGNVPEDQIVAANIDTLFIVNALNQDFNLRKIERYLIAAWESGAQPVVLLTKADLCPDAADFVAQAEQAAPGVPVHAVSAFQGEGKEELAPYLQPGATIGVTGSSGVGKSTLLNWLAGEELQLVQGIRESDARGRHTTTHRELFLLRGGALVVDTPGMRELQLWEAQDGWQTAFSDIAQLATQCRYRDCRHQNEPGCAVQEATQDGTLDPKRLANYRKTSRELAHMARKEQSQQAKSSKQADRAKHPPSKSRSRRVAEWEED